MTTYSRVAIVTGANKGIGLAIVRQLALQYPTSLYNKGPFLIYLTARNEQRGSEALDSINSDSALGESKVLQADGGPVQVKYHPLDIDSQDSIKALASTLQRAHPDGVDFLINNAGIIATSGNDINIVKSLIHSNYYGTLTATLLLLPLVKDAGRIVNVASEAGTRWSSFSPTIKSRFRNAAAIEDVTQLMETYISAVETGTSKDDWPDGEYSVDAGWPGAGYVVSKTGVIAMTRLLAHDVAKSGSKVLINNCCPGYVVTDMTMNTGFKTPDQGAQTPVMLAIGDIKGANGQFWVDEEESMAWVPK